MSEDESPFLNHFSGGKTRPSVYGGLRRSGQLEKGIFTNDSKFDIYDGTCMVYVNICLVD